MNRIFLDYSRRDLSHNADIDQDFNSLGACLESVKKLNFELERTITNEYLDGLFGAISQFVTGSNIIGEYIHHY